MPHQRHPRLNEQGFTLVEVMVVVVIAGILIGFGYSGFTGVLNRYRCQGALNRVAQVFKLTQMKSIEQSVRYFVTLGAGNETLTVTFDNDDCATTAAVLFDQVNLQREYPGINVTSSNCSGFYFDFRGRPRSAFNNSMFPCSVKLTPNGKPAEEGNVTISSLGRVQVVTPVKWKH
jgi:prepilin-type N-terminal cleavage/methylation domain-containing protein